MQRLIVLLQVLIPASVYAKAVDERSNLAATFFKENATAVILAVAVIGIFLLVNQALETIYRRFEARMSALEARQAQHRKQIAEAVITQLRNILNSNEVYRKQLTELVSKKTAEELEKALSRNELPQKVNDLFHEVKSVSINQEVFQDNIIRLCEYLKTKEDGVFKEVEETNARIKRRMLGKAS